MATDRSRLHCRLAWEAACEKLAGSLAPWAGLPIGVIQDRNEAFELVELRLHELRLAYEGAATPSTPAERVGPALRPTLRAGLRIVSVGASGEGLAAISKLIGLLPRGFPAAILVALRGHPQGLSVLGKIANGHSSLPVAYVAAGDRPTAGLVHVPPPGARLIVRPDGVLGLKHDVADGETGVIDELFSSTAAAYGPRAVGVILSGCEGDGVEGLKAIEEADGLGIVQDPEEASKPGLPSTAIAQDRPHYVARIEAVASLLESVVGHGRDRGGAGF